MHCFTLRPPCRRHALSSLHAHRWEMQANEAHSKQPGEETGGSDVDASDIASTMTPLPVLAPQTLSSSL